MKTLFFTIAFFTFTVVFSQNNTNNKKIQQQSSSLQMNKAELIDAIASNTSNAQKRKNPQTGKEIKIAAKNVKPTSNFKFQHRQNFGQVQQQRRLGVRSSGSNQKLLDSKKATEKFNSRQQFGQTQSKKRN